VYRLPFLPFPPVLTPMQSPSEMRGIEELHLKTKDGARLLAGFVPGPPGIRRGFLLIPGFWGDWRRKAYMQIAKSLSKHGAVLAANMRGHPGSSGWFSFGKREHLDAATLVAEARRRGLGELTAVGFSLGGWAFARHLSSQGEDRAQTRHLVLVSTPAFLPLRPRPWKRGLFVQLRAGGKGWMRPDLRGLWPPRSLADSLAQLGDLPVSFIYAQDDWMVPPKHGETLRAAAAGPSRWVFIADARGLHAEMVALFHAETLLRAILDPPGPPQVR
jgi:hypothetical protein